MKALSKKAEARFACILMTVLFLTASILPLYPLCTFVSVGGALCIAYIAKKNETLPLVLGLCISVLGDWGMGMSKYGIGYLICGILFFLIGHILFSVYYLQRQEKTSLPKIVFAVLIISYTIWFVVGINPNISEMILKICVMAYITVSAISVSSAFGLSYPKPLKIIMIQGMMSLAISDTIIAYVRFINTTEPMIGEWIMPLYMLSHYLISLSSVLYYSHENET